MGRHGGVLLVGGLGLLFGCGPGEDGGTRGQAAIEGAGCEAGAPGWAAATEELERLFTERRQAGSIPGMAAGVVCADTLVWAAGYGTHAVDDSRPVDPDTRFRVASITKLFTATAVVQLAERGALDLDEPLGRSLPWFQIGRPPPTGTQAITVRQLLTHTSGMPRDSRLTDFDRLFQPSREAAIAALPEQELESSPGTSVAYSNLGYALLGEVIQAASGTTYSAYLRRNLLGPLEMHGTLVHPDPDDDTAWGHGPLDGAGRRAKAGFWELRFATPAGGMAASVPDLARFMMDALAPYRGQDPTLLSRTAMRSMHEVQVAIDPARGGMGLGWAVEVSSGQHVVYHGGELPEQTAFLMLDLNGLIGVVVLTNAQDADVDGIAQEALRIVREAVLDATVVVPARAIP